MIHDMPKIESPFIRKDVDGHYVVTPEINPDYAWVFSNPEVRAVEKLHGTNVSILVEGGTPTRIFNRTNEIAFFSGSPIVDCLLHSLERGWLPTADGQWFGEAVGPKIQANPLKLPRLWIPLSWAFEHLAYTSWHKYPKTYENISSWFKDFLFSLAHRKYAEKDEKLFAEGVVFTHPDGRMAKLRRDMFDWWTGPRHKE